MANLLGHGIEGVEFDRKIKLLGIVPKIEHAPPRLDSAHAEAQRSRQEAEARLRAYRARLNAPFREPAPLDERRNALAEVEVALGATAGHAGNDNAAAEEDAAAA